MRTRMGLIGKGEEGLREVVSAAEGLLETLYNATADPAFWRVPVPSNHTAQRPCSATPGGAVPADREPLGATIEAAHLRYRAASNALKEVLTELEEEYRGRGPSGEGGGGEKAGDEQQGGEKEGEAKQGAENEGDAKQGVKKEAADEEGATEAVEEEGLGGGSGEEEAPREGKVEDGEGQSVEMEGESAEGAEREVGAKAPDESVQGKVVEPVPATDIAALRALRDSLKKRVAAKNTTLDALAAKLEAIIDAVTLWQSVGLVRPAPLDHLER